MRILKSFISKITVPTILSAALLTTALSFTGTTQPQNTESKKTHTINAASTASHLGTHTSGTKNTIANETANAPDTVDTNTIQNFIKAGLKTGWTAARLIGIAGCFKLAHMHREEVFIGNILQDYTYADYTIFGTYLSVAGIIAQNIYKSYENSIKAHIQEFLEEEDGEEGNEQSEGVESEDRKTA